VSGLIEARRLPYQARARIADNALLLRKRAGYSQEALSERALVAVDRISKLENGSVVGPLDAYVRLAGGLLVTLDELLAGVTWTPGTVEFEYDAGYQVEFNIEGNKAPATDGRGASSP
jgi:transcriptional regulator with XRE-family HTH domain